MKKLLMGFGAAALLTTGCTQPSVADAPPAFESHRVYVVTADCGNATCPYPDNRYVFLTRDESDARRRFTEVVREMVVANPDSNANAPTAAPLVATGKLPNKLYSWFNGSSFTINIDVSYL